MATPSQVENILQISGTYSLITGSATITDVTNYASLGIASPDTVKILLYIQSSVGQNLYKNAGYDASDYSSPDLEPLLGTTTYTFSLPTVSGGDYLTGNYTVNMKVQVVQTGGTFTVFKQLYQNIIATCNGIIPNVQGDVSYNTAEVSVTDFTNYKNYSALSNTLILYPPPTSGQSSQTMTAGGSPATLVYVPPMGTYPYTGVWTWKLTSDISYTDSVTQATTTCRIIADGTFNVQQSQLCVVLCYLKAYRNEVAGLVANGNTYAPIAEKNLIKAEGEYLLAFAAERCGRPQTEINVYIDTIYKLINKSPNDDCGCGCGDGNDQPLVPTSIINGTNGTDGASFLQGTGAPAGGLGAVGDSYLDVSTGDVYLKTAASTWTYTGSLLGATGATGATGAAGANGADGVALLYNNYSGAATTGTLIETLDSFNIPANTFATNGDMVQVTTEFTATASVFQPVTIYFNGSAVILGLFYGNPVNRIQLQVQISRTGAGTVQITGTAYFKSTNNVVSATSIPITTAGGLNFAGTLAVAARATSATTGDITNLYLRGELYNI